MFLHAGVFLDNERTSAELKKIKGGTIYFK